MEDIERIKESLYSLQLRNTSYVPIYAGDFLIFVSPSRVEGYSRFNENDNLSHYEIVDISLYEKCRTEDGEDSLIFVGLESDFRFANYQPIKYYRFQGLSNGESMPLGTLCELIKYLYRLKKIAVFM